MKYRSREILASDLYKAFYADWLCIEVVMGDICIWQLFSQLQPRLDLRQQYSEYCSSVTPCKILHHQTGRLCRDSAGYLMAAELNMSERAHKCVSAHSRNRDMISTLQQGRRVSARSGTPVPLHHAGSAGEHPSIAATMLRKIRHSLGFCVKHTAPPPLKLCACMRFMSPMHTSRNARIRAAACLWYGNGPLAVVPLWCSSRAQPPVCARV